MNTTKSFEIAGKQFYVSHASALNSGYGHKKITVELTEEFTGESKRFNATTNDMPSFDAANNLEGQDKYEAFYELIDTKIEDQVYEWLED